MDLIFDAFANTNKIKAQTYNKIPSFTDWLLSQFSKKPNLDYFKDFTIKTGRISNLKEKERLKNYLQHSPLNLLTNMNECSQSF